MTSENPRSAGTEEDTSSPAADPGGEARRRITAAVERARGAAAPRRVMVVFTGDWCGDSTALLRSFEHPLVAPLVALGFEVVTLDVGNRDRHVALAEGWGISYAQGAAGGGGAGRRRRAGRRHPRRAARLGPHAVADRRRDLGPPLAAGGGGDGGGVRGRGEAVLTMERDLDRLRAGRLARASRRGCSAAARGPSVGGWGGALEDGAKEEGVQQQAVGAEPEGTEDGVVGHAHQRALPDARPAITAAEPAIAATLSSRHSPRGAAGR